MIKTVVLFLCEMKYLLGKNIAKRATFQERSPKNRGGINQIHTVCRHSLQFLSWSARLFPMFLVGFLFVHLLKEPQCSQWIWTADEESVYFQFCVSSCNPFWALYTMTKLRAQFTVLLLGDSRKWESFGRIWIIVIDSNLPLWQGRDFNWMLL